MGEHGDLTRLDPGGRGTQVVATRTRYGVPPSCPAVPGVVRFQHQTESTDRLSASPARKSHSKSQRRPVSGDTQLPQATVEAGQVPGEPSPATPSDARKGTGGQGVAGSNPAVPTGSQAFSENIYVSLEPAKEPSNREMALPEARADQVSRSPTRAFVKPAEPAKPAVKGSRRRPRLACAAAGSPPGQAASGRAPGRLFRRPCPWAV
jgi:hypothetical protein